MPCEFFGGLLIALESLPAWISWLKFLIFICYTISFSYGNCFDHLNSDVPIIGCTLVSKRYLQYQFIINFSGITLYAERSFLGWWGLYVQLQLGWIKFNHTKPMLLDWLSVLAIATNVGYRQVSFTSTSLTLNIFIGLLKC